MIQESNSKKFASVLKYVNLPNTRKLNPVNERLFQAKKQDLNQRFVSPELRATRNKLLDMLQGEAEIFDNVDYNFVFPPTIFPDYSDGQGQVRRPIVNVSRNVENQDTFGHKLSSQQIQSIRQRGQFKVASNINNGKTPHVWKINDCIVRGRVNIREVWRNGVSACCELIISSAIYFTQQIPQNIKNILRLPARFFDLIFGKRAITKLYSPDYQKEVAKDFWTDIMQNELRDVSKEIDHNFLRLLYQKYENYSDIYYGGLEYIEGAPSQNRISRKDQYINEQQQISKLKSKISTIEDEFNSGWQRDKNQIFERISLSFIKDQQNVSSEVEQKIVQKVKEQQINRYIVHLRKNLPRQNISSQAIEALVHLVLIISYIDAKFGQKNRKISSIYSQTKERIREQYPIRSRIECCNKRLFDREYQQQKLKYQQQFYESLRNDNYFKGLLSPTYMSIYQKYLKTKKFYETLVENKKKQLKCLYGPVRVFHTSYPLLPEYEVKTTKDYSGRINYSLKKTEEMHTDTSSHFWKIKLYCMRYKSWTINWVVYLIGFAWVGPLGLRCLYGIDDFSYDENIDYLSGQKTYVKRETVLGVFKNVLNSINKSRADFQAQPDLGLLGKSVSRICNLIQCYFLQFLIVGILGVLVLYPIAIIFASLVCFVLVLTFWFWVPIAMIICYLFNIFIFQFEISRRQEGCLIKSIPLLSLILHLFSYIFRIVFAFVLLFFIAPILALLYFIFLIIQRVFRTLLDCLMVCIISCCGRTPSTDTRIARRISGPGMAENYYSSISQEDVYVLVNAELQKIFMNKFNQLTRQRIEQIGTRHQKSIQYTLQPFGSGSSYTSNRIIEQTKQKLFQNFNRRSEKFMQRYPSNPYNIRFTNQELDKYLQNSKKLVKNYIESNQISGWVYSQKGVREGDYEEINRQIWINIFGCGDLIFSPLEDINSRLQIEENVTSNTIKLRNNMHSLMRTLDGQIQPLGSMKNISIREKKSSILNLINQQSSIRTICQLHTNNSGTNVNFDSENPSFLFIAPRNLQQAKQFDKNIENESRKQKQRRNQTVLQFYDEEI